MSAQEVAGTQQIPVSTEMTIVHMTNPKFAARYRVLSGVLTLIGSGANETQIDYVVTPSMNRWWSRSFREQLFEGLGWMLWSNEPQAVNGEWGPNEYCRAAGPALVSAVRDEVGFGLEMIRRLTQVAPARVDLLTDNDRGLRFGAVLTDVGRRMGIRTSVAFIRPSGRGSWQVNVPKWAMDRLDQLARSTKRVSELSTWARASLLRLPGAEDVRRVEAGPAVAFFEPNPRGWAYSIPVMQELRSRSVNVVPLVTSTMDGERVRSALGIDPLVVSPRRVPKAIQSAIDEMLRASPVRLALDPEADSRLIGGFVRNVVLQRLKAYLPVMEAAAAAARISTRRLGVSATHQFSYASPAGRAFMMQAQADGAHTFATPHGSDEANPPARPGIVVPDTSLAWGTSRIWASPGAPNIAVTGNHVVEAHLHRIREVRASRRHSERPLILVAFGRPGRVVAPEVFASAIRLVNACAAARSAMHFVANIHPGDTKEFWLSAVDPRLARVRLTTGEIYELMAEAAVVVTMHSTAGGEAICVGLPVICITTHEDPVTGEERNDEVVPEYLSEGAAYAATSVIELCDTLDYLLRIGDGCDRLAPQRSAYAGKFLQSSADPDDSVRRVADAIAERV